MYDNKMNTREQALLMQLIDGDETAFSELYANYKNRLLYFSMRFVKSREVAEDIVQEAFITIWQNRRFLHVDTVFSAYLYTIIRNRVLNQLRSMVREDNLKQYIYKQAIDYTNDMEEQIDVHDLEQNILQATALLTPRQSEIFRMSREEGLSYKEIAQILNISVYTVQEHLTASLHIIRKFLCKRYPEIHVDLMMLLLFTYLWRS